MSGSYVNKDGLTVKLGAASVSQKESRGEPIAMGSHRVIDVIVDAKDIVGDYRLFGVVLDANVLVTEVKVLSVEAVTGATKLSLGLAYKDGTVAKTALLNALAVTAKGVETTLIKTTTGAGASIGAVSTKAGDLILGVDAPATAGRVSLRINFFVPGKRV